jgi:hypothetical protein
MARKRTIYLSICGAFCGIFIAVYLYINLRMTGHMTGMPRILADGISGAVWNILYVQLFEVFNVFHITSLIMLMTNTSIYNAPLLSASIIPILLLWFLLVSFALHMILKNKVKDIKKRDKTIITPIVFILIGIISWISIVALRFVDTFNFTYRILFPSSALLFVGFVGLVVLNERFKNFLAWFRGIPPKTGGKCNAKSIMKNVTVCMLSFLIIAMAVVGSLFIGSFDYGNIRPIGYREMKQSMLASHAHIPDGSMVLWGEGHKLLFLRDDLSTIPDVWPGDNSLISFLEGFKDNFKDYFKNYFKDYNEVHINIPNMQERMDVDLRKNDEIYRFFEQFRNSAEVFIRIK